MAISTYKLQESLQKDDTNWTLNFLKSKCQSISLRHLEECLKYLHDEINHRYEEVEAKYKEEERLRKKTKKEKERIDKINNAPPRVNKI